MAKKFTYRLESILKLKKHLAKTEKEKLLRIVSTRLSKENEISKAQNYLQSLSNINPGKISISELQYQVFHKNSIKKKIEKLNKEKNNILEIENIQRNKFFEIEKEEKALSQLKAQKFETYKQELNKEEIKTLDDIALNRTQKSNDLEI